MLKWKPIILSIFFWITAIQLLSSQIISPPQITLKNPYNTMYVHLYYLQSDSYIPENAAKTIYPSVDSLEAIEVAIKTKQVLDGLGLFVYLNQIPQENDYLDSLSKQHYYVPFPAELPQLYLEQRQGNWYYSAETVSHIDKMHKKVYPFGTHRLINLLPKTGQQKYFGLSLWQYLGIALILLFGFIAHFILSRIISPLEGFLLKGWIKKLAISKEKLWSMARLLSLIVVFKLMGILLPVLQMPASYSAFGIKIFKIIGIVLFAFLFIRIIQIFVEYGQKLALNTENRMDEQLIPIVDRFLKIAIVIFAVIQVLRVLDVNITALIAGISIGGLALALAAQDTVKNLIGSILIFVDKPFQIGDYIEGGDYSGTVEEVGFRSTRIRTSDTSLISVPNGNISNATVKNLGARYLRLFSVNLKIEFGTPSQKIESFMEGLKKMIRIHPKTHEQGDYYVHLVELGESALSILFRCHLSVAGYAEELKVKEELYLSILKLAEELGIDFAFPTSSVFIESNTAKSKSKKPRRENEDDDALYSFFQEFKNKMDKEYPS